MFLIIVLPVFTISLFIWHYTIYSRSSRKDIELSLQRAILITGCDSGIGLQLAHYFYHKRLTIICGYINDKSEGYKQLKELSERRDGQKCIHLVKLDVTSAKDIENTVEFIATANQFELYALINNAGVCIYGEFDWLTLEQIDNLFSINIIGSIKLTKALLKFLIRSKGRIINVSSVNDSTVFPGLSIYSATKSALSTFSRGISYELKKFGMNVIIVRLGDFAKLTNIMSRHEHNKNQMWANMNENSRVLYRDFFDQFHDHIMKNYGLTSPRNFLESSLFRSFHHAVLCKSPPHIITCTTLTFRIFYWIVELLPIRLQHLLLDLMFKYAFGWKNPGMGPAETF